MLDGGGFKLTENTLVHVLNKYHLFLGIQIVIKSRINRFWSP